MASKASSTPPLTAPEGELFDVGTDAGSLSPPPRDSKRQIQDASSSRDKVNDEIEFTCYVTCMSFADRRKIREYYYKDREPARFTDPSITLNRREERDVMRRAQEYDQWIWEREPAWSCGICERTAVGNISHEEPCDGGRDLVRWNIVVPLCKLQGRCREAGDRKVEYYRSWVTKALDRGSRCPNCSKRLAVPMIPCQMCWNWG